VAQNSRKGVRNECQKTDWVKYYQNLCDVFYERSNYRVFCKRSIPLSNELCKIVQMLQVLRLASSKSCTVSLLLFITSNHITWRKRKQTSLALVSRNNDWITYYWCIYILSTIGLFLTYRTDSTDYLTISGFTSLNGLICLHSVLDKAGSQSVFKRT